MSPSRKSDRSELYDLEALRSAPAYDFDVEHVTLSVQVRRPKRDEFVRTHPDDAFVVPQVPLLEYDNGEDRALYWLAPDVRPELIGSELAPSIRWVRLFTAINRRAKTPFLWAATLPTEAGNSGRAWHTSALQCAEMARDHWIKMVGDRTAGAYKAIKATGDLGDPDWGELTLPKLVEIAFVERTIETTEHPAVRELRGEA
jgi:hypothetical protein